MVHVGYELRAARTRRLLTREELDERAGVSPSTAVVIERDNRETHFRTIRKLAKALDAEPTELLGEWQCTVPTTGVSSGPSSSSWVCHP